MCADFKVTINEYVINDPHPIPTFEEVTSKISGFTEMSKIDFKDAYHQIPVDEESQQYLVIATHRGYFAYRKLPFGLRSAPEIFSKYMDQLLMGMDGVTWYLDDILTGGRTESEHLE